MDTLFLDSIRLVNYRNHGESEFTFSPKINGVLGLNGVGKTSLLDGIHFLSMCKSYFASSEKTLVRKGEQQLMASGIFERAGQQEEILGAWQEDKRKVFKRNGAAYRRLAEHIGQFPCVVIAPKDHELIDGHSELRRRFMDQVIAQSSFEYVEALLRYNRLLLQRNALLKESTFHLAELESLLEPFDVQMEQQALCIHQERMRFASDMKELISTYYQRISGGREEVQMTYVSDLHETQWPDLMQASRKADIQARRTQKGIHKDDLVWSIEGEKLRSHGSQGQQKSFLIALKLAQFDFLARRTDRQPILLLDDIFDKLDAERVTQLIELVNTHHFGQIFLSDTDRERTSAILQQINEDSKIIHL